MQGHGGSHQGRQRNDRGIGRRQQQVEESQDGPRLTSFCGVVQVTNFERRINYMKVRWIELQRLLFPLGSLLFGVSLMATPIPGYQDTQQTPPDNTKQNKDQTDPTADQQKMNPVDRASTQKIP